MQQNGWELPQRTYVAPYVLPQGLLSEKPAPRPGRNEIREIVFFGRLEIRKGLKLFCDALDELCADRANRKFEVTFLGKETQLYPFEHRLHQRPIQGMVRSVAHCLQ
jgi:glycosyltransferase involved in cell wall biosynthesis